MDDFESHDDRDGFFVKVWRGERMCLLGFDVIDPEPDLVGFALECRSPGSVVFYPLRNRLAFDYGTTPVADAVTGDRRFPSAKAPFQKFRWIHFPHEPRPGEYTYRATKIHMPDDGRLTKGTSIELTIPLDEVTYHDFVDVGFTRNFASSQAFREMLGDPPDIDKVGAQLIPTDADQGLDFKRTLKDAVYDWLGFEAYDLILRFLDEAVAEPSIEIDVFAYDLNEPEIVGRLEKLGPRLRAIIDNSQEMEDGGTVSGHGAPGSAETAAAARLRVSAGDGRILRMHFNGLQHHKVLIAKRNGSAFKALVGSTNFSWRGLYVQANNMLVFDQPKLAGLFERVFEAAFLDQTGFRRNALSSEWFPVAEEGKPLVRVCFAPHRDSDLSLKPVAHAIASAESSVLYSVAFLSQIRSGPTKQAFDDLMHKRVFSYGVVDSEGGLGVRKPDGSVGLVDFAYLADHAPEPFKSEWSGGRGINVHHKFVVIDFSLPTAKLFTGSSNLAPSGEQGNGDHLIEIDDPKIATAYAIEALRMFDHLHFRSRMEDVLAGGVGGAGGVEGAAPASVGAVAATNATGAAPADRKPPDRLTLKKPRAISGEPAWFEKYYVAGSQAERDRRLFAGRPVGA